MRRAKLLTFRIYCFLLREGPKLDTFNKQIQGKGGDMQKNLQSSDTIDLKRSKGIILDLYI